MAVVAPMPSVSTTSATAVNARVARKDRSANFRSCSMAVWTRKKMAGLGQVTPISPLVLQHPRDVLLRLFDARLRGGVRGLEDEPSFEAGFSDRRPRFRPVDEAGLLHQRIAIVLEMHLHHGSPEHLDPFDAFAVV